jgi:hypothetical protein
MSIKKVSLDEINSPKHDANTLEDGRNSLLLEIYETNVASESQPTIQAN